MHPSFGGWRLLFGLAYLALPVLYALPYVGFEVSICVFYNLTGLPCPGCGLTRSSAALLHGDLWHSFRYHPLGSAVVTVLVLLAVSGLSPALGGALRARSQELRRLVWIAAGALLVLGTLRVVAILLGAAWFPTYFTTSSY